MTREAVLAAVPHREPFLLIDEIVAQDETTIHCRKRFTGEEYFFRGHYPHAPITPGVLLCEAGMQAGAALLSKLVEPAADRVPVAVRIDGVKFRRPVFPGETIDVNVELTERLADAFYLKARITCCGQVAARFEFACTMAELKQPQA